MTRISTYGSQQLYLQRISDIQARMQTSQTQVSTKLKSLNYAGIASDANQTINLENEKRMADDYVSSNALTSVKLSATDLALDSVSATVTNIKTRLSNFLQGAKTDRAEVEELQSMAMQAMQEMQGFLNTTAAGEFLFSGGRVKTDPVELTAQSLADFQAKYDGYTTKYPTQRSANLLSLNTTAQDTGAMVFKASATQNMITTTKVNGVLAHATQGSLITVANSTSNNQTYSVTAQPPTNTSGNLLREGTSATGTITVTQGGAAVNPATGNLTMAYAANGQMTMTPANAGSLANLKPGTTFTVTGDANYNGAFEVESNVNGVITFKNNTAIYDNEAVSYSNLNIYNETDAAALTAATSGSATFDTSTGGLTVRPGPGGSFAGTVGDTITITGTEKHDGRYVVNALNADGSMTLTTNPIGLQVSKFREQTGRTDVTLTYGTAPAMGTLSGLTLDFHPTSTGETIHSQVANAFMVGGVPQPAAGAVFKLDSTSGVHDGTYEVVSNNGTDIVIRSNLVTNEAAAASATMTADSWYKGDTLTTNVSVDESRSIEIGMFASDPAFEKVFRALGILSQGAYGTAGGLDQNTERASEAMYLLQDALNHPASGTPPYGEELSGDLGSLQVRNGQNQKSIDVANTKHKSMSTFLGTRVDNLTQVDTASAIIALMNDQNSLEASYQALSQTSKMSLLNYLS